MDPVHQYTYYIQNNQLCKGTVARELFLLRLWGHRLGPTDVQKPLSKFLYSPFIGLPPNTKGNHTVHKMSKRVN